MSNLDITNNYEIILTDNIDIIADGVIFSTPIDVASADAGFVFVFLPVQAGGLNGMVIDIKLQDSDGSGFIDIPDNKILSSTDTNSIILDTDPAPPEDLRAIGAFSNNKLVRAELTITNRSSDIGFSVFVYRKQEQLPPSGS